MAKRTSQDRVAIKTPEGAFVQLLETEYQFSPRWAGALLQSAQELLVGSSPEAARLRPGQVRQLVARLRAPFGPPLTETAQIEVRLTVDAGPEDVEVQRRAGLVGLRQGRILRLIEEGLGQGGVLSQEDLARALQVDVRTIRRDIRVLKAAGHLIHTRGQVKGVGRGQTHKVRIIELWLDREGYDKIARWMHHSPQAIKRYVSTFLRIVVLHRQGTAIKEIAFVTQSSMPLVEAYLAIYETAITIRHRAAKLEEELARVSGAPAKLAEAAEKGGLAA